jgi:hypothetical protein
MRVILRDEKKLREASGFPQFTASRISSLCLREGESSYILKVSQNQEARAESHE